MGVRKDIFLTPIFFATAVWCLVSSCRSMALFPRSICNRTAKASEERRDRRKMRARSCATKPTKVLICMHHRINFYR